MEEIAKKLARERKLRSWSQEQVAEKLGTSASQVSRWERGRNIPDTFYNRRLCDLYEKSPQELGFFSEEIYEKQEPVRASDTNTLESASQSLPPPDTISWLPFLGRRSLRIKPLLSRVSRSRLDQRWGMLVILLCLIIAGFGGETWLGIVRQRQLAMETTGTYATATAAARA